MSNICKSRKSTHTIMANGGRKCDIVVRRNMNGTTIEYIVPSSHMFEKSRKIKAYGLKAMEKFFKNAIKQLEATCKPIGA